MDEKRVYIYIYIYIYYLFIYLFLIDRMLLRRYSGSHDMYYVLHVVYEMCVLIYEIHTRYIYIYIYLFIFFFHTYICVCGYT